MTSPLAAIGVSSPVLAAPMAGGPSTPALVAAAARAGGLGFLAGGYKTPSALAEQIKTARSLTPAVAVNLFAPNPLPVDPEAFRRYARELQPEADRYRLDLSSASPVEDDDAWQSKIDLLLADPVPVVSFTFGLPVPSVITRLRAAGTLVAQTVTSAAEARAAAELGIDLLVVQSSEAGAHSGTLTPHDRPASVPLAELVSRVRAAVSRPVIACGGVGTSADVAAALHAGAFAVAVGTVLLRTDESGASRTHRDALASARSGTVVTHAFTGRPARGLRNRFTDLYGSRAPLGYPALHHLTSPLRRAAAEAGDAELVHLWAGTGYQHAAPGPAADVLQSLTAAL
jgi:nitronate monooxygenase